MASFIFLSGPSCVGKGPLLDAFRRSHGSVADRFKKVTLYNSRAMRPGESEGNPYFFRKREFIEGTLASDPNFMVFPVRKDLQALDLHDVRKAVPSPDSIGFLEVFHLLGAQLSNHPILRSKGDIDVKTVFLSPMSRSEILDIKSLGGAEMLKTEIFDLMKRKLAIRTLLQKGSIGNADLMDNLRRAGTAYEEMRSAPSYRFIISNHDGEMSPNWGTKVLFGDALKALKAFEAIVFGSASEHCETWEPGLLD